MVSGISISNEAIEQIVRVGFAFVNASGELRECMEETFVVGEQFFELDTDAKLADRLPHDAGYRPYGQEYSQSKDHPDEVESFTVSYRSAASARALSSPGALLYRKMTPVFEFFEGAAEEITSRLAARFGRPPNDLVGASKMWSLLQFNYARPSETTSDFINDVHEDGCLLTIMSVAGAGLEILSGNEYAPIEASDNQVLVMAGEILWLLTGGQIKPVYHRVRRIPSVRRRKSLLFFADIDPASCAPWLTNGVNQNVDIGGRVLRNSTRFGLSEWSMDGTPTQD